MLLDDALSHAQVAVRLGGNDPRFAVGLACVHVDRGDNGAARDALFDALTIAPDDVEAHLALAHLLLAEGEYRAGWEAYDWRFRAPRFQTGRPRSAPPASNCLRLP